VAGYFTRIEVRDPHLLPQLAWEKLPPSEKVWLTEGEFSSQQWAPLDRRSFRIEPESYRTESLMANVGALRLSRNTHNRAKETTVRAPGMDGFAISMIERGVGQLVLPGSHEPVIGNATTGLIYSGEPGTRLTASDLQRRLFLRLPAMLLRRKLEVLLDGEQVDTIAFQPRFDQTRGAGATIRRMSDFLFAELEHSDTLLTNGIAIRSFEENLALCVLLRLPHNYTERLGRQKAAAAPGNVKLAEAFMRDFVSTHHAIKGDAAERYLAAAISDERGRRIRSHKNGEDYARLRAALRRAMRGDWYRASEVLLRRDSLSDC
jgi:AraC-binding-like domain